MNDITYLNCSKCNQRVASYAMPVNNICLQCQVEADTALCGNVGPGGRICGVAVDHHDGRPHTNVRQGVGRDQRKVWA